MRIERRCQSSFEPGECQDIQDPRSSIGTTTVGGGEREGKREGGREGGNHLIAPVLSLPSSLTTSQSPPSAVMPTAYSISLRPGDPLRLPIDVTTVRNLPLDVYILFDLTSSLRDEIAATRNVSSQISKHGMQITLDFSKHYMQITTNFSKHYMQITCYRTYRC